MTKVNVTQSKLDSLAESVGIKAERRLPLTIDEMKEAVDGIDYPPTLQDKTVSPKTTAQTVEADEGYAGLSSVTVNEPKLETRNITIASSGSTVYVPTPPNIGISEFNIAVPALTLPTSPSTSRTYTNKATIGRSTSTRYLNIPSGFNSMGASYTISAVANGTAGTPTATKGTVSNHQVSVTPSVTNTAGYISGGTNTGTAVTVTASELASGTKEITANGTGIDVTNYASVDVAVPAQDNTFIVTVSYNDQHDSWEPDCTFAQLSAANTAGKTITVMVDDTSTSNAVADGYFQDSSTFIYYVRQLRTSPEYGSDMVTESSYEWTANGLNGAYYNYFILNNQTKNITPSEAVQRVYPDEGYTGLDSVRIEAISSSYVGSGITRRSSSDLTASGATVTAPAGYYASAASNTIASGSRSASATKGTVSNHSVSVTPTATTTAGYLAAGSTNGTAVTVSASELVSGSETKTANGTYDVTNLAQLVVDVQGGGGSGMQVATATSTPSTASTSIQFTGLQGEPTSFYVVSAADLATGSSPFKVAAVVYDGSDHHAQIVTSTSNAQATYDGSSMSHTYSNGTLTVTSSSHRFQAVQYKLVYTHGGTSANIGTDDVQVGSGATSISFTGLTDEPTCWSLIFKSNFGTSSGYQRVMAVSDDGNLTYGVEMDSGAHYSDAHWSASYSNGTLTISSQGTNAGGYFHQPGYYQLTYGIGGEVEPPTIEPLTVTQNGTYAETGKAYSPVTVNVSGGGSVQYDTKTATASDYPTSLQFTGMKGEPKFLALRLNAQVSSSGSTTYYYIVDIVSNGTTTHGNCFRIGSTRRVDNITSGYSWSYSGTTLTITSSAGSRSASPGAFYSGSYELMYAY